VATTPHVLTFAEFEQLPWPEFGQLELRNGEVFQVAPPQNPHYLVAQNLRRALTEAAGSVGEAGTEFGFRLNDREYRIVDVAFLRWEDWANMKLQKYFTSAPELVVEILSPSNTHSEMVERETLCLENGAREFWVVDLERHQVRVSTSNGHFHTYKPGDQIPLHFGGSITVDNSFS
jgi:Uma2 family endonuclease